MGAISADPVSGRAGSLKVSGRIDGAMDDLS
jgi:hypothetical protein